MKLAERTFNRKDYYLTSPYGWRIHPITKVKKFHSGSDYGTYLQKWDQLALESGKVISAGVDWLNGRALFAWVEYPRINLKLLYYHLDQVFVKKGQIVERGTLIGKTGSTGYSTAIHLHLGVKLISTNTYINPESVIYEPMDVEIVDGHWNELFTRDLQIYFGTSVDRIISGQYRVLPYVKIMKKGLTGSQLIRAIQRSLGIRINGQLDIETVKAMQRKLGTIVDGIISENSQMVMEMKKRLKAGVSLW